MILNISSELRKAKLRFRLGMCVMCKTQWKWVYLGTEAGKHYIYIRHKRYEIGLTVETNLSCHMKLMDVLSDTHNKLLVCVYVCIFFFLFFVALPRWWQFFWSILFILKCLDGECVACAFCTKHFPPNPSTLQVPLLFLLIFTQRAGELTLLHLNKTRNTHTHLGM